MKLFLTGLPASGKSTLGKALADKLSVPFFDLDDEIEASHKMPIPEIFAKYGEDFFRKAEKEALHNLVKSKKVFVIATGGGTPCFFDNMDFINRSGESIFLNVNPKEIADRLNQRETQHRPLLNIADQGNLKEKLEELLSIRIRFYKKAHLTITSKTSLKEIILQLRKNSEF